jgi:hypothetical protein
MIVLATAAAAVEAAEARAAIGESALYLEGITALLTNTDGSA